MAVEPGIFDFVIKRNSDHQIDFTLKDKDGIVRDITSFNIISKLAEVDANGDVVPNTTVTAAITPTTPAQGKFRWSLTATETGALTASTYTYDIRIDDGLTKEYYVEGQIFIKEGISK